MYSLVLALSVLTSPQLRSINDLEGVWMDANGHPAFVGNGRMDWKIEDRYYTAIVDSVPDGTLLGSFLAGRDIFVNLAPSSTSAVMPDWASAQGTQYYSVIDRASKFVTVPHLGPDIRTFARPAGEVRIALKTSNARGLPAVVDVMTTPEGSHTPIAAIYTRAMPMDQLSLAGTFADKDVTLELQGAEGRVGELSGTFTYLGKKYSLAGRRIMGRGGFIVFDDSRLGARGTAYVSWSPSSDRADMIRNGDSRSTDQVDLAFQITNGGTATGIHKTLKRKS